MTLMVRTARAFVYITSHRMLASHQDFPILFDQCCRILVVNSSPFSVCVFPFLPVTAGSFWATVSIFPTSSKIADSFYSTSFLNSSWSYFLSIRPVHLYYSIAQLFLCRNFLSWKPCSKGFLFSITILNTLRLSTKTPVASIRYSC